MPNVGDIYAVYNGRLKAYVAFQLTQQSTEGTWAVLALDWMDSALPDAATIASLRPALFSHRHKHRYLDNEHEHTWAWVGARVPREYLHIGSREPLVTGEVRHYGSWPDGACVYRQRRWDMLDTAIVRSFKDAVGARPHDATIILQVDDVVVTRGQYQLDSKAMNLAPALEVFNTLPLLGSLKLSEPVSGLIPWLRTRPLISHVILSYQQRPALDLRGTHLTFLSIDVTGMRELYLNDGLDTLVLRGKAHSGLVIHAEDGGRWLTLECQDSTIAWSGLPDVTAMNLHDANTVDAAYIADRFPRLERLSISGAPCTLEHPERLGDLSRLTRLQLSAVFPSNALAFPLPSRWPHLSTLWLRSIPAALAAFVKKAYKAEAADGLDLVVRQPRKPEWLAANLDNPFRDWEGSECITSSQARKAAALYRKARADALKRVESLADQPHALAEALQSIGHAYIEGFNAMYRRSSFIDTAEREQICEAWSGIVDAVEGKRRAVLGDHTTPMEQIPILEAIGDMRKF